MIHEPKQGNVKAPGKVDTVKSKYLAKRIRGAGTSVGGIPAAAAAPAAAGGAGGGG